MEEQTQQVSLTISSSSSSYPLFSCFITLYTLFLIFFPHVSLRIFLSPVLLISGALLLCLLHLGSTQESNTRPEIRYENLKETQESSVFVRDSDTNPDLMVDFVEWNLRAPLEVIHEAYEEEEREDEDEEMMMKKRIRMKMTRPGLGS
ncbi:hypothetical protein V5N11_006357 [Cardamine amara subsp. amara]|uniref:Transmembrane protein n=1 Tax=Cardamine amara subsp. amara TaxID=228776 RepID=A0ABD1ACY2_CARAN